MTDEEFLRHQQETLYGFGPRASLDALDALEAQYVDRYEFRLPKPATAMQSGFQLMRVDRKTLGLAPFANEHDIPKAHDVGVGHNASVSPIEMSSFKMQASIDGSPASPIRCSDAHIALKRRQALERVERKRHEGITAVGRQKLEEYGLSVSPNTQELNSMRFCPNKPKRVFQPDPKITKEQSEVLDAVRTRRNVFFTGSAGVGKSFLLKEICRFLQSDDRHFSVTAPTGIAAVNISGMTIHSWARIGKGEQGWIDLIAEAQSGRAKEWMRTQALIIDEISMLTPSLFEKLDQLGRALRGSSQPYGGIQIIACGDFFQLPPVEKLKSCWKCGYEQPGPCFAPESGRRPPIYGEPRWLRCNAPDCHFVWNANSTYAFETHTWEELQFKNVVLTKVFRQTDKEFIECLNRLRYGHCTDEDEHLLKSCLRPLRPNLNADGTAVSADRVIRPTKLYPLRALVDDENRAELARLRALTVHVFHAHDENIGNTTKGVPKDCQAQAKLELTVGCQVMLLVNRSFELQLVNGSRGVIVDFVDSDTYLDRVEQELKDNEFERTSLKEWRSANFGSNYERKAMLPYVLFATGRCSVIVPHSWTYQIDRKNAVRRTQMPLNLAWAMTIHKAQGLTLDRALIDLTRVFSYGQAYVALSRCRSLAGLQIQEFIPGTIRADPKCQMFYEKLAGLEVDTTGDKFFHNHQEFGRLLDRALDFHFETAEQIRGSEDRERQIFLETVADRFEEARSRHAARVSYASLNNNVLNKETNLPSALSVANLQPEISQRGPRSRRAGKSSRRANRRLAERDANEVATNQTVAAEKSCVKSVGIYPNLPDFRRHHDTIFAAKIGDTPKDPAVGTKNVPDMVMIDLCE